MSVSTFGVTANGVRAHLFPQWGDFSVKSSPTLATAGEIVQEAAGELAARLYEENVDAAAITDAASAAYLWCARTLRLMAALRIMQAATQRDPELAKAYAAELAARFKKLDESGATALGDESLATGTSDPDGPTSHVTVFGLTTDAAADMSDAVPFLRKDDRL